MSKPDIQILELLSSKICHDLISPIGAINNGLEILEELGPDAGDDVTGLISYSARQASAKLQAYRLAYGAGSTEADIKPENVHKAIQDFISGEDKFKQDWDPHGPLLTMERPTAFCKILTSALLMAIESMPKGGILSAAAGPDNASAIITGSGDSAAPRPAAPEALNGDLDTEDLEPRLVHPYTTGLLARHYGFTLRFAETQTENQVTLILSWPEA